MVTDPVCGMQVDESKALDKVQYQGRDYYFCSPFCCKAFVADPRKHHQPTEPRKHELDAAR